MSRRRPAAPPGLGRDGRRLWRQLSEHVAFEAHERNLVAEACFVADTIARLRAALEDEPLVVDGSTGQAAVHPAVRELRAQQETFGRLLARIAWPADGAQDSRAGQRLADARWRRGA